MYCFVLVKYVKLEEKQVLENEINDHFILCCSGHWQDTLQSA